MEIHKACRTAAARRRSNRETASAMRIRSVACRAASTSTRIHESTKWESVSERRLHHAAVVL